MTSFDYKYTAKKDNFSFAKTEINTILKANERPILISVQVTT